MLRATGGRFVGVTLGTTRVSCGGVDTLVLLGPSKDLTLVATVGLCGSGGFLV